MISGPRGNSIGTKNRTDMFQVLESYPFRLEAVRLAGVDHKDDKACASRTLMKWEREKKTSVSSLEKPFIL